MQKNNPGDMSAKQQLRRIASKERRKRRQAKFVAALERKIRPLMLELGRVRAEVQRYQRQEEIARMEQAEPSTTEQQA